MFPPWQIPCSETGLTQWLYDRYIEKERMLTEFYTTGVFPDAPSLQYPAPSPRKTDQNEVDKYSENRTNSSAVTESSKNVDQCTAAHNDEQDNIPNDGPNESVLRCPSVGTSVQSDVPNSHSNHTNSNSIDSTTQIGRMHLPKLDGTMPLLQDPLEFILRHAFFICSTYMFCRIFYTLLNSVYSLLCWFTYPISTFGSCSELVLLLLRLQFSILLSWLFYIRSIFLWTFLFSYSYCLEFVFFGWKMSYSKLFVQEAYETARVCILYCILYVHICMYF